jgi:hypothetical protein
MFAEDVGERRRRDGAPLQSASGSVAGSVRAAWKAAGQVEWSQLEVVQVDGRSLTGSQWPSTERSGYSWMVTNHCALTSYVWSGSAVQVRKRSLYPRVRDQSIKNKARNRYR